MSPASLDEGLRAAFAKAEAREPIHRAAAGFVPMESRIVFMAWVALLEELRECVFELSDPRVTAVKSGWWAEELDGVARGAARHPLTRVLVRSGGPWAGIGNALLAVASDDAPSADLDGAVAALSTIDHALIRIHVNAELGELERGLEASDRGRVPLMLFARHGLRRDQLAGTEADALRRDWAMQLHDALPAASPQGWAYPRLIGLHTDRRALRCAVEGRGASRGITTGFLEVWQAWRCARNAALQVHPQATHTT